MIVTGRQAGTHQITTFGVTLYHAIYLEFKATIHIELQLVEVLHTYL